MMDLIRFYASDSDSRRIIAYGDTHTKKRKYKIEYFNGKYHSFVMSGGKYYYLGNAHGLNAAKEICEQRQTKIIITSS